MKQSTKIIIAGLFVILLGVALIVVFFFLPRGEDNTLLRPKILYALNAEDIASIEVQNEDSHYTLVNTDAGLVLKGYEDRVYNTDETDTALRLGKRLYAFDTIESNAEDLSIYGLDDPDIRAVVTNAEQKKLTVLVGDMLPSNDSYYVMIEGDDTVYGVESEYVYPYLQNEYKFLSKRIIPSYAEDTGYLFENFVLTHNGESMISIDNLSEDDQVFYNESGFYKITEPYNAIGNNAQIMEYFDDVGSMTAARIQTIGITDEALAEYNLTEPAYTLSFRYADYNNPEDITLYLSEIKNGFCNVYREGGDTIYSLLAAHINLIKFDRLSLTDSVQFSRDINMVDRVVIDMPDGETYVYGLTRSDGKTTVTMDGKQINFEQFKKLFSVIISSRITDMAEKPEDVSPAIRLTLRYTSEDRKNDTLAFYPINDRLYYMELNGAGEFSVSSVYIDKLIDSVNKLNSGEDFSENW